VIINTKRSIQTLLMGVTTAVVVIATVTVGTAQADTTYKFVSMPDYWNADVGDVSGSPFYSAGMPNSINASYQATDDYILSTARAEGATDMLVAGDFVEGHWGIDTDKTGVFGPVTTTAQKRAAVKLAGDTYYPQVMDRFTRNGFTLYPALGDHEIGDNDWNVSKGGMEAFKYNNLSLYKQTYSRHMMQTSPGVFRFPARPAGQATGTAYAVRLNPDVQLISLDVFRKTTTGVVAEVDATQLAWVEKIS